MRVITLLVLTLLKTPLGLGMNEARADDEQRPNVVFVLTDDQRADHLGCAGHPFLETPAIDRLAREGVRFTRAFVTTSLCSPSRASFLSGLYASRHGVVNNFTDYPADLASFPSRLQAEGYRTAYVGKWHMGEEDDRPRPGFDHWVSHRGQGDYFHNEFNINGTRRELSGYYTEVVTELAMDWLKAQGGDQPFLLILGHKAPHTPFTPSPKYAEIYRDITISYPRTAFTLTSKPAWVTQRLDTWHGIYGPIYGFRDPFPDRSAEGVLEFERFVKSYTATIRSVDDSVARLTETLREEGELDQTIFVFAGDNGMFLGEHGMTDKRTMHEPSIQIPLIVRYPQAIRPGTLIDRQVLNIDLAPSLLELCQAQPIPKIDGRSWVPLLTDASADWRDAWFYEYNYEKQFPYTPNVRGVRTERWKYIRYPHGDGGPDRHRSELYNLVSDPDEVRNLADDPVYAGKVEELTQLLDRLIEEAGDRSYSTLPIDAGIQSSLPAAEIR